MENRDKQDGIRSWCQLVRQYETGRNRNVRIKIIESFIDRDFHHNYRGELVKWIQECEDAFTELALLGQKTCNGDEINNLLFVQKAQNIFLNYKVFEEIVSDKSFIET
jgi:ribosomal protein L21E